jgi:S1-C subfamily serine protease
MKYYRFDILLIFLMISILNGPVTALGEDDLERAEEVAFRQTAAKVNSSVVRIQVIGGRDRVGNIITGNASTTGVIMSEDGFIISSAFNFISKPSAILIELSDGRRFPAKRIGTDYLKMLTLLKIEADELPVINQPGKVSYEVGQWAISVGKSYQSDFPNVSVGIISAINRISGKAIQTDAKISPVNYGGPLLNIKGEVLGILVPLATDSSDETAGVEWYDSGIGFAIPFHDVSTSVKKLQEGTDLYRGYLGIQFKKKVALGSPANIVTVRGNSPAKKSGLKAGDRILKIDGKPVHRVGEATRQLGNYYAGEQISLVVERGEKKETKKISVTLVKKLVPFEGGFLGILPDRESIITDKNTGVGIRHIFGESPAEKAGLKPGDRILKFEGTELEDSSDLLELITRIPAGKKVNLTFERDSKVEDIEIVLTPISTDLPSQISPLIILPAQEEKISVAENKDNKKNENSEKKKTGHFRFDVKEHAHRCWAYVPEDYNPEYPYGLMVWLHPADLTMESSMLEDWKGICDRRGLIILSPLMADKKGWSASEDKFVEEATREFLKKYNINPNRVVIHCFDDSAPFSYYTLFKNRDLFHGGLFTNAPLKKPVAENNDENRLQFYLSGQKSTKSRSPLQKTFQFLKASKYPIRFDTFESKEGEYPSSEMLKKYEIWIDTLDRI